jgi:hypothetical protein
LAGVKKGGRGRLNNEATREKLEKLTEQAKVNAKSVGRILFAGGVVSLLVISARLFGMTTVSALNIVTPLRQAWILFVALSLAHSFWARFLALDLAELQELDHDNEAGKQLLRIVATDSGIMLRGLIPRVNRLSGHIYAMSLRDPSTWLSCGLALSVFVAILPWHIVHGSLTRDGSVSRLIVLIILGLIVLFANWTIGGTWILMLSQLAEPDGDPEIYQVDGSWPNWMNGFITVQILGIIFIFALLPFIILVVF